MRWIIIIDSEVPIYFAGLQGRDEQHLGDPHPSGAMKFSSRQAAEAYILAHGIRQGRAVTYQ
jgi:hypothetical protein